MFEVFESVMDKQQVRQLRDVLLPERFSDGAATAHGDAQKVKKNLQLSSAHPQGAACSDQVIRAINACDRLSQHVLPVRMTRPFFNLYGEGMSYGKHTDSALMSAGGLPLRTDYSITLFLSEPSEYDGGELVFTPFEGMPLAAKLSAGSAVVYPSNTVHEVRPVTRGRRFAAVLWMQSALPYMDQRHVLHDLDRVRGLMDDGKLDEARERLKTARENLVHMFARP